MTANVQPPGYLQKKAKTGKWQKRWFETNAHYLTYYKVRVRRRSSTRGAGAFGYVGHPFTHAFVCVPSSPMHAFERQISQTRAMVSGAQIMTGVSPRHIIYL